MLVSKRNIAHSELWFKAHQVSWDISRFKAFSATCSMSPQVELHAPSVTPADAVNVCMA